MRLTKVFIAILFLSTALQAEPRYYGAIDLGSKGAKAALYSFIRSAEGRDAKVIFKKTINHKLASSMNSARFSSEGIRDATDALRSLTEQMRAKAKENRLIDVTYYIVGSSGVAKGENRDELAAAVKKATGIEIDFIDARDEGYFGLSASVERDMRSTAIFVDIGSGNTKLGCVVGDLEMKNFKSSEIPYGSVTGRNEGAKRSPANIKAGIDQLMQEEVAPAYSKAGMDTPCLRNRKFIFWVGGAAWATAALMHPERALNAWVKISRKDLETFLARLADGTWNQRDLVYVFPKNVTKDWRVRTRIRAQAERNDVMDTFAAEDLLSGVSIMKTVLEASNPSAEIRFARNGNYLYGYAIDKYREGLRAPR